MSTPDTSRSRSTLILLVAGIGTVVAVVTLWTLLRSNDSSAAQSMAKGVLVGGGIGGVAAILAGWRAYRSPEKASSSDRIVAGRADERDRAVWRRSTSVLGTAALPLCGVAAVATALGAPSSAVMAILLWAQLILLVVTVVLVDRRT